jgi:hypothetical protein
VSDVLELVGGDRHEQFRALARRPGDPEDLEVLGEGQVVSDTQILEVDKGHGGTRRGPDRLAKLLDSRVKRDHAAGVADRHGIAPRTGDVRPLWTAFLAREDEQLVIVIAQPRRERVAAEGEQQRLMARVGPA